MEITLGDRHDDLEGDPSEEMKGRIKAELDPGERLIWASRRVPRADPPGVGFFWAVALVIVLFAYAFSSVATVVRNPLGEIGGFVTFGILAGVVGLCILLGLGLGVVHRRRERARAENSMYALTDRRAIVWRPHHKPGATEVHAVPRGRLANIHRVEYPDGSGDVVFSFPGSGGEEWVWGPSGFEDVPEVRRVEEQVRRILVRGDAAV